MTIVCWRFPLKTDQPVCAILFHVRRKWLDYGMLLGPEGWRIHRLAASSIRPQERVSP